MRGYYSVPARARRRPLPGRAAGSATWCSPPASCTSTGLPDAQRNWANEHTVYTHGYGMIAAYGNQRDADGPAGHDNDGEPVWAEEDLPPQRRAQRHASPTRPTAPQIYFGENSPNYSIVGKAPGGKDVELDVPAGQRHARRSRRPTPTTARTASAVGSIFNKLLYAMKFGDANIVLSSPGQRELQDPLRPRRRASGCRRSRRG